MIWSDNTSDDEDADDYGGDDDDVDDVADDDDDDDDDTLKGRLVKYKERLPQWVISVIAGLRFAQGAHTLDRLARTRCTSVSANLLENLWTVNLG